MGIRLFKEVIQGQSGTLSDRSQGVEYTRVFKMLVENPSDVLTINPIAAVSQHDNGFFGIGTLHPQDKFSSCSSVSIAPDGDSRLAFTITVQYTPSPAQALQQGGQNDQNQDQREQPPDQRPANWSTSTTTIEVPSWYWVPQWGADNGRCVPIANPAGDIVDGITVLQPIVNITVEQYCAGDQTVFSRAVGQVNSNTTRLGSLPIFPRSVLFRGVSFKPHAEAHQNYKWRGWLGTFEFSYKPNFNNLLNQYIGWDIAIPLSGYNIKNQFGADVDKGACHLVLENDTTGAIKNWPNPALAPGTEGKKMRANVLITTPTENGTRASQRPSASPVPLNEDGSPRDPGAPGGPVLVRRYQIYDAFDMSTLGLRIK